MMSWIKLDDQWMDHPKIVRAGRDARDMWLASITWCAKHLTDGYFPKELLPSLAVSAGIDVANCQTFARTLLDVCLWELHEDQYCIHDYLEYNPTKEQAEATKAARSIAGRAGGVAKASKMASKTLAKSWQKSAPSPSPSLKESAPNGAHEPTKSKPKTRDERLDHPAIIAYRTEANMHVPVAWRDEIIEVVTRPELWQQIVHDWIGRGWNKQNVKGMLEVYAKGGAAGKNEKPSLEGYTYVGK